MTCFTQNRWRRGFLCEINSDASSWLSVVSETLDDEIDHFCVERFNACICWVSVRQHDLQDAEEKAILQQIFASSDHLALKRKQRGFYGLDSNHRAHVYDVNYKHGDGEYDDNFVLKTLQKHC